MEPWVLCPVGSWSTEQLCVSPCVPFVAQHLAQKRGSSGICWMSERRNQKLDWFK